MISSAFQLGQRVCDLISENLTPTITATATVSAIDDADASSNFIVKYSQKSATFKRQIDMIKRFNSSSSSSSTSMLSGSEFGSCSTTWNCQKPRRWAPVQFSPLTTPVRRYVQQEQNGLQFAYDTVQSLPVTPVPPSSPTFSEPTHSSCTNNYETSDDILEHFNQLQDVACFNSQLRKASSSSSQYAKPRLVNSSSNFSSGVRRCDKFGVSLEAIREGIELRDCSNASTCSHEDFSFTKSSGPSHALPLLHHGKEQSAFENEKIINHKLHAVGEMGCCQSCSLLTVSKRDSTETKSSSNSDARKQQPSKSMDNINSNTNFAYSTLRGPTFKANKVMDQPAVWSPKARVQMGKDTSSASRTASYKVNADACSHTEYPESNWNHLTTTKQFEKSPMVSSGKEYNRSPAPVESAMPNETNSTCANSVVSHPPPPPPPPPPPVIAKDEVETARLYNHNSEALQSGSKAKRLTTTMNEEEEEENRSTVVIPETQSVATLRNKIQSQLNGSMPVKKFTGMGTEKQQQEAVGRVAEARPNPADTFSSISSVVNDLEWKRWPASSPCSSPPSNGTNQTGKLFTNRPPLTEVLPSGTVRSTRSVTPYSEISKSSQQILYENEPPPSAAKNYSVYQKMNLSNLSTSLPSSATRTTTTSSLSNQHWKLNSQEPNCSPQSTYTQPLYAEVKSPSPPTIPPTPVGLLSPSWHPAPFTSTATSGNYSGNIGNRPLDQVASSSLRSTTSAPVILGGKGLLLQKSDQKQESPLSKNYQHHWYKMMFKKLHQVDKNDEENAIMRYRIRDYPTESQSNKMDNPIVEPSRSRSVLSPEPSKQLTTSTITYRQNRSKSLGRSRAFSPAGQSEISFASQGSSSSSVGFHHQPRRIEEYTPGNCSILENASTTKNLTTKQQNSDNNSIDQKLQATLDTSQGLIQRILGDLNREIESRKVLRAEDYSDIDFWLQCYPLQTDSTANYVSVKIDSSTQCGSSADANLRSLSSMTRGDEGFRRKGRPYFLNATAVPKKRDSAHSAAYDQDFNYSSSAFRSQRSKLGAWSFPVCCRDSGSKLYALERSKTVSFHLPPYRLRPDLQSERLNRTVQLWQAGAYDMTFGRNTDEKSVQTFQSFCEAFPNVPRNYSREVDFEKAYDEVFQQLSMALDEIEQISSTTVTNDGDDARSNYGRPSQVLQNLHWLRDNNSESVTLSDSLLLYVDSDNPLCQANVHDGVKENTSSRCSEDLNVVLASESPSTAPSELEYNNNSSAQDGMCFTHHRWRWELSWSPRCALTVDDQYSGSSFAQHLVHANDLIKRQVTATTTAVAADDDGRNYDFKRERAPRSRSVLDEPRSFDDHSSRKKAFGSDSNEPAAALRRTDSKLIKALALYNFQAQNARELNLEPGDKIIIRRQIDANWCEGEVNGRVGIFPINYVEVISESPAATNSSGLFLDQIRNRSHGTAKALFDFTARRPRELSIKQGEVVNLIREVDKNWSFGFNGRGEQGIFPSSYVKPCIIDKKSKFASVFDKRPSKSKKQNDDVGKLVVDGVVYGKADPLEAILNEMKLYSASLQSKPNETKSTTSLFSPGRSVSTKHTSPATSQIDTYEAIYEYLPANSDELELKRGDIVYVVECCDDGWFIGTSLRTGKFGTFPGNYVKHL